MITSFQNVDQEFIKQFGEGTIVDKIAMTDYRGTSFDVILRSSLKSADNTVESERDAYPLILITSFTPKFRKGFRPDEKPFYTLPRDTDSDDKLDTITQAFEPLAMVCRYEVNLFAKNARHFLAMTQWMIKNFEYYQQHFFTFNKTAVITTVWGDADDGEKVEYSFQHLTDPVRTDGVKESIYEFLLYPYVYVKDPVDLPIIQELNIGLSSEI